MPIMTTGEFWGIDEVKGRQRFNENVANALRGLGAEDETIAGYDRKADEYRAIAEEYEERISK